MNLKSMSRMPAALAFTALAVGSTQANDVISAQAGDIRLDSHRTSTTGGVHSRGKWGSPRR
jgi:hypothetical protein